jgi:hypothetical protein
MENNKASDLFRKIPKFSSLIGYFDRIEINDLKKFTRDDLKNNVEPKDRLILHVLIEDVLKEYLFQPTFQPLHDGTLNLRSKLSSTRLKVAKDRQINCEELIHIIGGDTFEKTRRVICSHNDLFECDVRYLFNLVAKMPNCFEVDLSFNRLYGTNVETKKMVDNSIKSILELPQVKYVVVIGNVIASLSQKDFFLQLNEDHLKKLIWIPSEWISGKGWKLVLENEKFHPMIEELHKKYWNDVYDPV